MTIAEWLTNMTVGDALRLAVIVVVSVVLSVPLIRLQLKREGFQFSTASRKTKTLYIAGLLTGLLLSVVSLLLRNHITVGH